jgi:hypothetical protein
MKFCSSIELIIAKVPPAFKASCAAFDQVPVMVFTGNSLYCKFSIKI